MTMRGPPGRCGRGSRVAPRNWKNCPSKVTGSSLLSKRVTTSSPSSKRLKRVGTSPRSKPKRWCSRSCQPAPRLRIILPLLRSSRAAAWRASSEGLRTDNGATNGPKWMRCVWSARYVSDTIISNESLSGGRALVKWSERNIPAKPRSSTSDTSRFQ